MKAARDGDGGSALDALVKAGKVEALSDPGLDAARRGDVETLRRLVAENGWDPAAAADRHGSCALLWAAGGGHLPACRFLVEDCGIDPKTVSQRGRRAYHGRTALHWAARNGHLDVCEYFVKTRGMDVDARTGEGTTAFAWACWRGHVRVMRWLAEEGDCSYGATNAFGCNAAMWCVQGGGGGGGGGEDEGDDATLAACEYVRSLGVTFRLLNANGHSVLHKAAQRGNRAVCLWLLGYDARAIDGDGVGVERSRSPLVDASHLAPDNEGFAPSDLARLAGDARLSAFLAARERDARAEEDADARETDLDAATRARLARVAAEATPRVPPVTFYAAAATGDVDLLRAILAEDPYYPCQDNGGGALIHVAVAYAQLDVVKALLDGEAFRSTKKGNVCVNQRGAAGGFGLTPLHIAGALFLRIAPERDALAAREAAVATLRALPKSDKAGRKEAWKEDARARKILTECAGASRAREMYRALLQHGADPRAVARVPLDALDACGIVVADGIRVRDGIAEVAPRDLAGETFRSDVAALEAEASEAPPARTPHARHGEWSFLRARYGDGAEEEDGEDAPKPPPNPNPRNPTPGEITREDVAGVPGAFVLRGVVHAAACAALASTAESMQPVALASAIAAVTSGSVTGYAPRRETAAARAIRTRDVAATFASATRDPLALISATAGVDGAEFVPVEPAWFADEDEAARALAPIAARCRPHLPPRAGDDALAAPGLEFSPALRCYRYLPGTASPPHYDKHSTREIATETDGVAHLASAYTVVVYLNGDAHEGGATTFYRPIQDGDGDQKSTSRRGKTWAVGNGAKPLFERVARVRGGLGDVLFFPHRVARPGETRPFPYEPMLHEGSPVFGAAPKYILRTDLMFETRMRQETAAGDGGRRRRQETAAGDEEA